jgi:hypothetical protein
MGTRGTLSSREFVCELVLINTVRVLMVLAFLPFAPHPKGREGSSNNKVDFHD